jgi:hypothetical protein
MSSAFMVSAAGTPLGAANTAPLTNGSLRNTPGAGTDGISVTIW